MQNMRFLSLSQERLCANSQELSHVIFSDRRKVLICMDLSHGNFLWFYIYYEWIS
jgi:hypothetical protein